MQSKRKEQSNKGREEGGESAHLESVNVVRRLLVAPVSKQDIPPPASTPTAFQNICVTPSYIFNIYLHYLARSTQYLNTKLLSGKKISGLSFPNRNILT